MARRSDTMGRTGFVEAYGLWSDTDAAEAERVLRLIAENDIEVVRLSFPDQHGILRGKTIMAPEAAQAMRNGCAITTTLLAKDTSHTTVFPVFSPGGGFGIPEMENAGDFVAMIVAVARPKKNGTKVAICAANTAPITRCFGVCRGM